MRGLWAPQTRALTTGLVLTITFVASEALAVVTVCRSSPMILAGCACTAGCSARSCWAVWSASWPPAWAADRRGPAIPFVAGLVLFGSGLTVAGLAPSMGVLVAGRVLQGLGAGAIPSVAYARAAAPCPPRFRPA